MRSVFEEVELVIPGMLRGLESRETTVVNRCVAGRKIVLTNIQLHLTIYMDTGKTRLLASIHIGASH